MNKYIQQFLDDNDLQAGERFYILNSKHEILCDKTFYINKNFEKPEDILKRVDDENGHSYAFLSLLVGTFSVKKIPFCPKHGEIAYYVSVSGNIREARFDNDSTLHRLLCKAGKFYRTRDEAERHLDEDYKDLIIQEEE